MTQISDEQLVAVVAKNRKIVIYEAVAHLEATIHRVFSPCKKSKATKNTNLLLARRFVAAAQPESAQSSISKDLLQDSRA